MKQVIGKKTRRLFVAGTRVTSVMIAVCMVILFAKSFISIESGKYTYQYFIYLRLYYEEIIEFVRAYFFKGYHAEIVFIKTSSEDIFKISTVYAVGIYAFKQRRIISIPLQISCSVRYGGAAQQRRIILLPEPFSVYGMKLCNGGIEPAPVGFSFFCQTLALLSE